MDSARGNLKLFVGEPPFPEVDVVAADRAPPSTQPFPSRPPVPDSTLLANRELIRPTGYRRATPGLLPFSAAWYDELAQKRYQRHGVWLPTALEFGRHPGESLLLLGPGVGSDAIRYIQTGTPVTIGVTVNDYPDLVRANLNRHALSAELKDISGPFLPFLDGTFDVVTWNALHEKAPPDPARVAELFRVLKSNGKVIALFPAHYDAGYWQDLFLPLQWIYWRRPADPTIAPKTTGRQLRKVFAAFSRAKISKRHLRRAELPHLWRVCPLVLLERCIGRVLILKAMKPLNLRTAPALPLAA